MNSKSQFNFLIKGAFIFYIVSINLAKKYITIFFCKKEEINKSGKMFFISFPNLHQ